MILTRRTSGDDDSHSTRSLVVLLSAVTISFESSCLPATRDLGKYSEICRTQRRLDFSFSLKHGWWRGAIKMRI